MLQRPCALPPGGSPATTRPHRRRRPGDRTAGGLLPALLPALLLLLGVAGPGCATTDATVELDGGEVEVGGEGEGEGEVDLGPDGGGPVRDLGPGDAGGGGPDARPPDGGSLAGFLEPCAENRDCQSGFCVAGEGGQRCTRPCNDDCPDEWACRQILNEGGDPVFVCVWVPVLCQPCDATTTCRSPDNLCLEIGDGTFCGRDCRNLPCPDGYTCTEIPEVAGARQCLPTEGWCTVCRDEDGDGRLGGPQCAESVDCDDTRPSVHLGADEICDELDNDCDGQTDEGFDLDTDPRHCGRCNQACGYPHAQAGCVLGECLQVTCTAGNPCTGSYACQRGWCCDPGWYNLEDRPGVGCTYSCLVTLDGEERCDGLDNDCDGATDEETDLLNDPAACGRCDRQCASARCEPSGDGYQALAAARCLGGECEVVAPTSCGAYTCDAGGARGTKCATTCQDDTTCIPGATCRHGQCSLLLPEGAPCDQDAQCVTDLCQQGTCCPLNAYNLDGRADNGCECLADRQHPDLPDDDYRDSNCDGIDGDLARALFVAPDGRDVGLGTMADPLRSVSAAVARAASRADVNHVYVAGGTYTEKLTLLDGVSVYGGYSRADGWSRGANPTVIRNATADRGRVVAAQGSGLLSGVVVADLTLEASSSATAETSVYGLHCLSCTGLTLHRCVLVAGDAGPGVAGGGGSAGQAGGGGFAGGEGSCDNQDAWGLGGNGGVSPCGTAGGRGGNGGSEDRAGDAGAQGTGGTAGGAGGAGGTTGKPGGVGSTGATGATGTNGGAGPVAGRTVDGFWIGGAGLAGGTGNPGNGGGGGGGGGGQGGTWVTDGGGNGGGGGGGGGCGGSGGLGGSGGGGSFGLFLVNSS
ncbi:MAG: putative metal-binding motif-containing protein, partial [Myxococcota bacterium]|nr:putative metal-binding motif-containing protein [Myxococcota bacterium]